MDGIPANESTLRPANEDRRQHKHSYRKERILRRTGLPAGRAAGLLLAILLALGLLLIPAVTGMASGVVLRLSTDSSGNEANGNSYETVISADGSRVAFRSDASNLVASDANGVSDIFVKVVLSGATTRVSTDTAGTGANGASQSPAISADGRYVAFSSDASNLVAADTNGSRDVFVKDTLTGITTRVSTDSASVEAYGASQSPAISADGRYVAFSSTATNLAAGDSNNASDIFVKDTLTGITTRVSTDSAGAQANNESLDPDISADGGRVVFYSRATNLVAGDTNNARDIFLKDTATGAVSRVSTSSVGTQADSSSYEPDLSADGVVVAFRSDATNLVSGDTNGSWDIFLKNTVTGVTTRVSTRSNGIQANGSSYEPSLSGDGRYVAFHSVATNLILTDTNGRWDIFIKDTQSGATGRVSADALGAAGDGNSQSPSITADGRSVAFYSAASNLVTGDGNGVKDVFLAATPACFGSEPDLSLHYGGAYWISMADYTAGRLTVNFSIDNDAGPDAYSAVVTGAQNTGGVSTNEALPRALGNIATGNKAQFSIEYLVPSGVGYFKTTLNVTAYDECGGVHYYPAA